MNCYLFSIYLVRVLIPTPPTHTHKQGSQPVLRFFNDLPLFNPNSVVPVYSCCRPPRCWRSWTGRRSAASPSSKRNLVNWRKKYREISKKGWVHFFSIGMISKGSRPKNSQRTCSQMGVGGGQNPSFFFWWWKNMFGIFWNFLFQEAYSFSWKKLTFLLICPTRIRGACPLRMLYKLF